jgi:hypothetical protein
MALWRELGLKEVHIGTVSMSMPGTDSDEKSTKEKK